MSGKNSCDKPQRREPKFGLTMRQPGLGKLDWIKEDSIKREKEEKRAEREGLREIKEGKGKKGKKEGKMTKLRK